MIGLDKYWYAATYFIVFDKWAFINVCSPVGIDEHAHQNFQFSSTSYMLIITMMSGYILLNHKCKHME